MRKRYFGGVALLAVSVIIGSELSRAEIRYSGKFDRIIYSNATKGSQGEYKTLRISQLDNSSLTFTDQPTSDIRCTVQMTLGDDYNKSEMTKKGLVSTVKLKLSAAGKENPDTRLFGFRVIKGLYADPNKGQAVIVETLSNGMSRTLTLPMGPAGVVSTFMRDTKAGSVLPSDTKIEYIFSFKLPEWSGRPSMDYVVIVGGTFTNREVILSAE